MALEKLPHGALVKLKSGGPLMTVVRDDRSGGDDRLTLCSWFDEQAQYQVIEVCRSTIAPTPSTSVLDAVARQIYERSLLALVLEERIRRCLTIIEGKAGHDPARTILMRVADELRGQI